MKDKDKVKLTYKKKSSRINIVIPPDITLDEMVENMECFLKAIGYQFDHLNYTKNDFGKDFNYQFNSSNYQTDIL